MFCFFKFIRFRKDNLNHRKTLWHISVSLFSFVSGFWCTNLLELYGTNFWDNIMYTNYLIKILAYFTRKWLTFVWFFFSELHIQWIETPKESLLADGDIIVSASVEVPLKIVKKPIDYNKTGDSSVQFDFLILSTGSLVSHFSFNYLGFNCWLSGHLNFMIYMWDSVEGWFCTLCVCINA